MPSSTHESASSDMSMQNNVSVASGPTKVRTPWSEFWRKFKRQRMTLFAGSFIGLLVLIAIFWPWLVPYDPENYFDYDMLNAGPSLQHWFGVDSLGRDIFSRILAGARISLTAGFSSVLVGAVVGTLLGLTSGYFEGWWDRVVMRVCDVLFAFPGILLAISVVAVLGSGMANGILAVAIFSIRPFGARQHAVTQAPDICRGGPQSRRRSDDDYAAPYFPRYDLVHRRVLFHAYRHVHHHRRQLVLPRSWRAAAHT